MARPLKPREMVFAGALHHDGSLVYAYYFVKSDGTLDDKAQLYPQPLGDYPPGAVCRFQLQPDGAVRDAGTFLRVWEDTQLVHEWVARHGATAASEAAWAAKDLPQAFSCLEPMRAAYRQLDEERQGVLLAQIVRYVVTPDAQ